MIAVVVLATLAALSAYASLRLWYAAARSSATLEMRISGLETAAAPTSRQMASLSNQLKSYGTATEAALWTLPRVDEGIASAATALRRRREQLNDMRATLAKTKDVAATIKRGWQTLQRAIELGRMLGW